MKRTFPLITALLLLVVSAGAQVQKIMTLAGNGTAGFSGDGSSAAAAQLNGPVGVAVDGMGYVYVEDHYNYRIRRIAPNDVISTFAGTGSPTPSGDGSISTSAGMAPSGVATDRHNNVYIADALNHVVRKVNSLGIITTVAGNGGYGYTGDDSAATIAQLGFPYGIAVDRHGNLYIADAAVDVIRMVDTTGIITTIAGTAWAQGFAGDGGPATAALLDSPYAVAVDTGGNVYITDFLNNIIRKVAAGGIINTYAGTQGVYGHYGNGGLASFATLNGPKGIATDTMGNLFIADAANNMVRMVDATGIITTVAGDGTAGFGGDLGLAISANLLNPYGVAVDNKGNLYIADANNQRVRKTYNSLGVSNVQAVPGIKVSPNPFSTSLSITGLAIGDKAVVIDALGREALALPVASQSGPQVFSLGSLIPGAYVLQVRDSQGSKKADVQIIKN